jgi:hypothetical protein
LWGVVWGEESAVSAAAPSSEARATKKRWEKLHKLAQERRKLNKNGAK